MACGGLTAHAIADWNVAEGLRSGWGLQISALVEQKEELEDELESSQAAIKRKDTEISQLRAQNEHLRTELQGEVHLSSSLPPLPQYLSHEPINTVLTRRWTIATAEYRVAVCFIAVQAAA